MNEITLTIDIDGHEYGFTVPCGPDATSVNKASRGLQSLLDGVLIGHFKKLRDGELL